MNTRLGSQAASRGTISILSKYSGSGQKRDNERSGKPTAHADTRARAAQIEGRCQTIVSGQAQLQEGQIEQHAGEQTHQPAKPRGGGSGPAARPRPGATPE